MTAPARLLALRLHGFKSFAERTRVEFGPGISAIVGPNGSGKSNLADALRWAFGEQGRSLRIRKSEDVIFAGSERRAALGMADVTLVLDNGDGLLPIDFAVLELGRRLYRSGENDYLLNRQRVRLRDLVDLLDAANLADNAFLFIGQGMVDQALALRPEERRPLFEEVAGVRRHERRRRRAEEQLVESEANLARVDDILAELRPQARRLAAQAEQQTTRLGAGEELAAALVLTAHARWHETARRVAAATTAREAARADADRAMAALGTAEGAVAIITGELGARAALESERRTAYDTARAELTALQLREARLASALAGMARDRQRLVDERSTAEADLATRRRELAVPAPPRDHETEAALSEAERALADALAELATLRAAHQARGQELAAVRRAEVARQAELETAQRRLREAERRAAEERERAVVVAGRLAELEARLVDARSALAAAAAAETAAVAARERARIEGDELEVARTAQTQLASAAAETLAALGGRVAALEARLAEEEGRGIARAARGRGGRRLDDGLQVDPTLRAAVEAALGEAARAYLVHREAVTALASERGLLVVGERLAERGPGGVGDRARGVLDRAAALGGGHLVGAVRRDPVGAATRLLERVVWLPDLAAALELQAALPPGWAAVARDGSAVVGPLSVAIGRPDPTLERRAELARLSAEAAAKAEELAALRAGAEAAGALATAAREALRSARADESEVTVARRRAEEVERAVARDVEAAAREAAWNEAQAARLEGEAARAAESLRALEGAGPSRDAGTPAGTVLDEAHPRPGATATWEARALELRARRDRLAAIAAGLEAGRREADARRSRAEAGVALDEDRITRVGRDLAALADAERGAAVELETLNAELMAATEREARGRAALDELQAADSVDRTRLTAAEGEAAACRERLRSADERLRSADVTDLEARLALDAVREGVLVELAGLGEPGLRRLAEAAGLDPAPLVADLDDAIAAGGADELDEAARLEDLLAAVAPVWARASPPAEPPSSGRLAVLRRRYHELGAANPFAVEEYAALKARLESLERQAQDLRQAIGRTRALIEELDGLIAEQFRTTFRALEAAFDRRFQQLFGGGFARLTLTEPADLAASGVEIVARPPGKRAQPLAMLSGGERALTAVALLFSMLEVRPVPFCVLDEVDAALDEANVGRFTEALRGLAERTQFIVITHNRGTIESADALYGVTVGDDSVSRVISLRIEEAQAIADDARRGEAVSAG